MPASAVPAPRLTLCRRWLHEPHSLHVDNGDSRWSVGDLRGFWRSIRPRYDIQLPTPQPPNSSPVMPGAWGCPALG